MNEEKSFPKTSINWFPGHMAKTKRQIIEDLKLIDIIVEILDARIPISSQNPDVKQYAKNKKRIVVLNKSDLADEQETKKWVEYFKKRSIVAIITDSATGKNVNELIKQVQLIAKDDKEKFLTKGRIGKSVRIMIVGMPNVGKSSIINKLNKKNIAQVGNRPGVTKQKQWIRLQDGIDLMDTPGVLWPKFESQEVGLKLAFSGTIKDDILEKTEIAFELVKYLLDNYLKNIVERYKLNEEEVKTILTNNEEKNNAILEIIDMIAKKRGAILLGGRIDYEKISIIILDEFRSGKLGRITLEKSENY